MSGEVRPVWLTREQRDALRAVFDNMIADSRRPLLDVIDAWDAAPADPVEEVQFAIDLSIPFSVEDKWCTKVCDAVLRALGKP